MDRNQFIEDVALHWEQYGMPRIAGRIIGLLMVCEPPHRSARALAAELGASKASISTMTRLLLAAGTIEAAAVPGDRSTHYRLVLSGFEAKFERKLAGMIGFRELAEQALALMDGAHDERTAELRELTRMYAFLQRELPRLFERWREEATHG